MKIFALDHLVLTVGSIERTISFYTQVLGMEELTFGEGRKALLFGQQKVNLHQVGAEFEPNASVPTPGSADLCFLMTATLGEAMEHLQRCGVEVEEGPVQRNGAQGPIESIYIRDPDGNLIELAVRQDNYLPL